MSQSVAPFEVAQAASTAASPVQPLYWSVRRELWESRSLYLAPAGAAVVFLLGFLISLRKLPAQMQALARLDPMQQHQLITAPYHMAAGLLMLTAMIVGAFYCADALYGERRDRSILFWKSLPISDLTAVLAKASIPLVILPLLTFAFTWVLQAVMLLVSSLVLWANGLDAAALWTHLSFPRMTGLLLYHLVTVHGLMHAPLYGWLLLVSAWARRVVLLWAVLPPAALVAFERLAFNSSYLLDMLEYRLSGGGMEALTAPGMLPMDPTTHPTPGLLLSSLELWSGLMITGVFLAIAVRLRHGRGPIA